MRLRSTAPEHVVNRYLRGKCFALAFALHRRTRLPLWGLMLGDELHHAFVADGDRDLAIDIRGVMSIEEVKRGARYEGGLEAREITEEILMETVFSFDPEDLREARRAIKDHIPLHRLPAKPRKRKSPAPEPETVFEP